MGVAVRVAVRVAVTVFVGVGVRVAVGTFTVGEPPGGLAPTVPVEVAVAVAVGVSVGSSAGVGVACAGVAVSAALSSETTAGPPPVTEIATVTYAAEAGAVAGNARCCHPGPTGASTCSMVSAARPASRNVSVSATRSASVSRRTSTPAE